MLCLSIYLSSFMSPNRILKFSSFKFIQFLFANAKTVDHFIVFKIKWLLPLNFLRVIRDMLLIFICKVYNLFS